MSCLLVITAVIQAAAAVIALLVTVRLARVARETLRANERMAGSAERQIAVMREQMAFEYRPNLVISRLTWPEGKFEVFNLGRWPALIYRVDLKIANQEVVEMVTLATPSGGTATFQIQDDQYVNGSGRVNGQGTIALEFFYGSTARTRYRLEGVLFHTAETINTAMPRVTFHSQGHIEELPELAG